jgi:prepilin-type N-terminal cleavage/methylation domain-containing protein
MLRRKTDPSGFTIIELLTVIVVSGILIGGLVIFFNNTYQGYLNLHQNALRTNQVSSALQRVARVLRGSNSIIDASANSITAYAYFTPRDTTLSKIRYYYDTPTKTLIAGVTPATGSPPNYTYNASDERKITILEHIKTLKG